MYAFLRELDEKFQLTRIDDHELPGLEIVTCVALVHTNHGKINMIVHEYT